MLRNAKRFIHAAVTSNCMKTLEKKYSVAAFVDILGYKDLIQQDSMEREIELFNDLKNTIDIALAGTVESTKLLFNFLDSKYESSERISERLKVKQFSDNIYFSFDYEEQSDIDLYFGIYIISNISSLYQRLMLGKGYFVRGGIACGLNMVDKNFIFSTALIKAVETEKETVYPRITMHAELKNKFLSAQENPFKKITQGLYIQDWAEHIFLNPFNQTSRNIKLMRNLPEDELLQIEEAFTKTQKRVINKMNKNFAHLFDDKQFNSNARGQISKKIKKYKNRNQSVYEKYLWSRNFLNWVDNKQSDLTFKYV